MDFSWPIAIPVISALTGTVGGFIWSNRQQIGDLKIAQEELRGIVQDRFAKAREERLGQIAEVQTELTKEIVDCFERARAYSDVNRKALDQINIDQYQEMRSFQAIVYRDFVREKALFDSEARIMAAIAEVKAAVEGVRAQRSG